MMKFGPRPHLQRRAARAEASPLKGLATDADTAKHPGWTVAAGIIFGRGAREAGHNRRER
jgi:hypothetical protein